MMGGSLHERHTQFPFEPLNLLTECGLHDVFPRSRAAEMTLFRKSHEVSQLT
jgi:hypothetical protein